MNEEMQILTPQEAADFLKVSISQVYRYIGRSDNPLPIVELSDRTKRIRMKDLQDWMEKKYE
jgi:excisionase family DNA binding protein